VIAARYWWEKKKARQKQLPPNGDWATWLIQSGRGFGKTRSGAEWIVWEALKLDGSRWAVIARTLKEGRKVCIAGESGLISVINRYGVLKDWNKTDNEITLTNGSIISVYTSEVPAALSGPQHHGAWCDELSSWIRPETWDQLQFTLRLGTDIPNYTNRIVITTTPKPNALFRSIAQRDDVIKTYGSLEENRENLTEAYVKGVQTLYAGTRLWRQEGLGELLLDTPGALWTIDMLDAARIPLTNDELKEPASYKKELHKRIEGLDLVRVILAVDPATTSGEDSDETGIVVVAKGADGRGYLLADRSCRDTPSGWAHRAVAAYEEFKCDRVVAEKNQGGDMVELTLRSVMPNISYKGISAKQGKRLRAEPIAALYEQGKISHVGNFEQLEDQLVSWVSDSGYSPDRLDAMVHGFAELDLAMGSQFDAFLEQSAKVCPGCNFPNRLNVKTCEGCQYQFEEDGPPSGFPYSN